MKSVQSQLNSKQNSEFKALVKLLETKDYKKGLKNVDKLLTSVPDNEEVLSLRAIFLYYNDHQAEGMALAKTALFKNLKSSFNWHIYGMINKASKNYVEAIKCFLQTLKLGDENLQLLRDTSNMQLHMRDYQGNATSRHQLLTSKPGMIVNWIGYALSMHLNGEYEHAFKAIKSAENIISKDVNIQLKGVEANEFKLYQIYLAIDAKEYKRAEQYLQEFKPIITDELSYNELAYDLYRKTSQDKQALEAVTRLIQLQPQNWKYYQMLLTVNPNADLSIYDNSLVKSRMLAKLSAEQFQNAFQTFVDPYFQKSIPSLFKEIIHLYEDQTKHQSMRQVYEHYLNKGPIQHVWAQMLLSQHCYYLHQYEEAYQLIEEAIKHTPTLHELYLVKAKILKKQEKYTEAYHAADRARELDIADRYLNNKAIKYALRANLVYAAQDLLRMFLRDNSNPYELQAIWFELAMGRTLLRLNYIGPAMQQFNLIYKQFQEMYEDQLDFYQFSIRKYTLRSLLQMIDAMDKRYNAKHFIQAAGLMLEALSNYKIYLREHQEVQQKKLTPAEKKKLAKQQQKIDEEKNLREQHSIEGHIFSVDLQRKYDLSGEQLLSTLKTEADVTKLQQQFAQVLIHTNYTNKDVNFKAFKHLVEFYIEQNRPLLCLKLLNKLRSNETAKNAIVNHKYQLLLLRYLTTYKGDYIAIVQPHLSALDKFDSEFWSKVQITSQLHKAIKTQCELILNDKPYGIQEESDDLDFLDEYSYARKSTKNVFYSVDPNKEWQDQQILL